MREAIADTSVLQYLFQAECLNLLPALYRPVIVPEGVAEEIAAGHAQGHSLPDLATLDWLQIVPVPHRRILHLASDLGKGEREVLSLAVDRPEAVALLDDRLARRMAEHLGIRFTGTLGLLLRAKKAAQIETVAPIIDRLEALGFRLDALTRSAVLRLAKEET